MKRKTVFSGARLVALLVALLVGATACPNPTNESGDRRRAERGIVVLQFHDLRALAIVPDISLEIESYDVSFTRTGVQPVTLSGVSGSATETEPVGLAPGIWDVTVSAFNNGETLIGIGISEVIVVARQRITERVQIRSLSGEGTLLLAADLSELELLSPSISGMLTSGATGEETAVSMSIEGTFATFEEHLEAGSYLLSLDLAENGVAIAAYVDSVLIVYNQTTRGVPVFREVGGIIRVTLEDEITRPIAITLEGLQETLSPEESMTVSVQTAEAVDSYQWYLDGYAIPGEDQQEITLGPGLHEGEYLLTVVVKRGEIYSAEAAEFTVPVMEEDPAGFSFAESVTIAFTIENWWYADYSSVLEVAFLREGEVIFSHDVGVENPVEEEGWVFSYGYVFAYADEAGSFTLLDVPPIAGVTEVRIVIDDSSSGTFRYQFFLESIEGQTFAVTVSQGNEIFVLTPG